MRRPNIEPELSFERLESEIDSGRCAIVVLSALEIGVFDVLGTDRERSVSSIAADLGVPERRLAPLLEALAALGYLFRGSEPNRYKAHPDAVRLLSSSSDTYRGDELVRWLRALRGWTWLSEVVRRDEPRYVGSLKSRGTPTNETHLCLAARGRRIGSELLEGLDVPPPRRVLDLGGGTGGYASAIAERYEDAIVTLFDRPEVIELARRSLEPLASTDRIRFHAGDFMVELPEGPFELVLVANVLHIFDSAEARVLVHRAARSVAPGGTLVVRDGMCDPDRRGPVAALLFGIHMIVFSAEGRIYSTDEVAEMLESSGLEIERVVRPDETAEGAIVIGRKPRPKR